MILIILQEIRSLQYRFPIYQQAKIKLSLFDKARNKQGFVNIQVPLSKIRQNTFGSLSILYLIV